MAEKPTKRIPDWLAVDLFVMVASAAFIVFWTWIISAAG
jgi:hypothetical protein